MMKELRNTFDDSDLCSEMYGVSYVQAHKAYDQGNTVLCGDYSIATAVELLTGDTECTVMMNQKSNQTAKSRPTHWELLVNLS